MPKKRVCPICGKKFSDIYKHLVLVHKIKDLNDLQARSKVDISVSGEKQIEKNLEINWDTLFYRTYLKLMNERRIIYIEQYLDELIDVVDKVTNKQVLEKVQNGINRIETSNKKINNKLDLLKQKIFDLT
ncbi:MAG: hypothetical protein ACOC5T_04790 [Elusimicrobiota bacterium]